MKADPSVAAWLTRFSAAVPAVTVLVFFALWELASHVWIDPLIISRPSWMIASLGTQIAAGSLWRDLSATLWAFFFGYVLAAALGVVLGLLAGWYDRLRYALEPVMWFFYNAPLIAFYPLLVVWLGLGTPTIIALAFLLAFFPIYVNTFTGMTTVNPVLIACARAFGAGTLKIFIHVALPASLPGVVAGLRLGIGRALVGAVIGELIGGSTGLGFRMAYAANHIDATTYFTAFLLTAAVGLLLTDLLKRAETRLQRYRD